MISLGRQHNGLYYISKNISTSNIPRTPQVNKVFLQHDIWHRRIGHPSIHPMKHLAKSVFEISISSNKICDICPLAKQTRLSFGLSSISAVEPFELIHCDIWKAFQVPSHSGVHYFLTIVDDFSRHTWIYLM